MGSPRVKTSIPVKAYVSPISFPQRLQKHKLDKQVQKFFDVFKKLHINIPFAEALAQMPSYDKFMKKVIKDVWMSLPKKKVYERRLIKQEEARRQ